MTFDTTRFYKTRFQEITFLNLQDSVNIVSYFHNMWTDSGPGVDTIVFYVENHFNRCREFLIWIRFDHRNLGETKSLPYLREDLLISKTCLPEESASHHKGMTQDTRHRTHDTRHSTQDSQHIPLLCKRKSWKHNKTFKKWHILFLKIISDHLGARRNTLGHF